MVTVVMSFNEYLFLVWLHVLLFISRGIYVKYYTVFSFEMASMDPPSTKVEEGQFFGY